MTTTMLPLEPKWYTVKQVAALLGFGMTKTKFLVLEGEIKSVKVGRNRRVLPEWVDEYIHHTTEGV